MGVLWFRSALDQPWVPQAALADVALATVLGPGLRVASSVGSSGRRVVLLVAAAARVHVNGEPVLGGFKVLNHRDELTLADRRVLYFSDETPAQVRVFELTADEKLPRCPVCRRDVEAGQTSVTCPRCGRVHHQAVDSSDLAAKCCWTYREACLCGHPTGLTADAMWRPEKELSHA